MNEHDGLVSTHDFNGLGSRVNELERNESGCRAEMLQRHDNHEKRLNSQNEDIKKIFDTLDSVKATINKGTGIIIAVNTLLIFAVLVVDKLWK